MSRLDGLRIKLFADGTDPDGILKMYADPLIRGFATNSTLMRKAGTDQYASFARAVLAALPDRPVSLEVVSDDGAAMMRQARVLASWRVNVTVKIPVTNPPGEFPGAVVHRFATPRGVYRGRCRGPEPSRE